MPSRLIGVCGTDLLAAFPAGVMQSSAAARLVSRPAPIALEPVSLHLVRHQRTDQDRAVRLVAELLRTLASGAQDDSAA